MPLEPGTTLGSYSVTAKIGEGGMGEVYQARDTKLDRDVALKVLPEAFTSDPERLARFEREAKVLASLNHPNIGTIYGLEEAEGVKALVLELIEGPTLADRIKQGPIPIDEALPIAKQIAEALEAAHEQGVIHRDLKPANIKVKDDGTVKVLDFGLAKALDTAPAGDPDQSPTLTAAATQMGVILGTAAYMSPEQARGKPVDKRADIWAFGVVLYEMMTGSRPFQGEDVSMILASVMKSDISVATLPPDVPPAIRTALRRCLQKDPKERARDVGDVRLAMAGGFESMPLRSTSPDRGSANQRWKRPLPLVVGAVLLVALGAAGWGLLGPRAPGDAPRVIRFPVVLPGGDGLDTGFNPVALSPDGTVLAYATNDQLYVRSLAHTAAVAIRGTDGAVGPFFSADGQWIGFWQRSALKKVAVAGGAPVTLVDTLTDMWGAHWASDDAILVGMGPAGIGRGTAAGGVLETLVSVREGEWAASPQMLPGGQWVLFTLRPSGVGSWDDAQIVAQSLQTGDRHVVIPGGLSARYVDTGHLIYILDHTLVAVPFDPKTAVAEPGPVALVESVSTGTRNFGGFDLSRDGTLAYAGAGGADVGGSVLGWVDRAGQMTSVLEGTDEYRWPHLSPAGDVVALTITGNSQDVWLYDLVRRSLTKFTEGGASSRPLWTPDGASVTFTSAAAAAGASFDLYLKPADGSGAAERLFASPEADIPNSWSRDGTTLVFHGLTDSGTERDIWMLDRAGTRSPFLVTEFNERMAVVSPGGRWLAYTSDQSGEDQIYVQPFPDGGAVVTVSTGRGTEPLWSRDGTELFFRDGQQMMVADIQLGETFSAGRPRVLFEGAYDEDPLDVGINNYDVAADGRFLMIKRPGGGGEISLVLNWTEELKARVLFP